MVCSVKVVHSSCWWISHAAPANAPDVSDGVAEAGAKRCPVNPRAAGVATHAEHPAQPASTAAAVAALLLGAIFDGDRISDRWATGAGVAV